jgi:signal transduction histidine kinase
MRRLRLSSLLVGVNVGLLLLAVAGVAIVAVRLLQRLADEQALRRVEQAGVTARQQIDNTGDGMFVSASLLSERPTLERLLLENDREALGAFLLQFQQTSRIDATAVVRNGVVVARTGAPMPWETLWTTQSHDEAPFLFSPGEGNPLILGAWATMPALPDSAVGVALRLDEVVARRLSSETGLAITLGAGQGALPLETIDESRLRQQALTSRGVASAHLLDRGTYQSVVPLITPDGDVVGLLRTDLPAAGVDQSVRQLVGTLLLLALLMGIMAGLISLVLGQWLVRPLRGLSKAAARIGHGDLQTPVLARRGAEIGQLAITLEEMRDRLLRLTDDLRRQRAEAQAILTGVVEGVFSVDRERRVRYLNPQAGAMIGVAPEQAIGRFCGDLLHPQGTNGTRPCEEHCPIVHARFRGGARATEHLVLPDGQRRTVVITSAPPTDEIQVQVMRDETEIEATRRLRDSILANISHEFRTPLSAQLASIELLLDQLPDLTTAQIGELVLAQQRGTLRLTQLIDNLLESARIEAGLATIRRQPVALDEVVEEALELTRPLFDQRGQEVIMDLPYPLPAVQGDGRRLTQVFVNLLGNAQKFAPAGSTIEIGGTVDRDTITLWVADQGPGLPVMAGQGIFQRFVRSSADEPEQSGVGLGLYLVKSIVERHAGRVEARIEQSGTRMCVVLPREQDHENPDR